jgi:hypothetical protein
MTDEQEFLKIERVLGSHEESFVIVVVQFAFSLECSSVGLVEQLTKESSSPL